MIWFERTLHCYRSMPTWFEEMFELAASHGGEYGLRFGTQRRTDEAPHKPFLRYSQGCTMRWSPLPREAAAGHTPRTITPWSERHLAMDYCRLAEDRGTGTLLRGASKSNVDDHLLLRATRDDLLSHRSGHFRVGSNGRVTPLYFAAKMFWI